MAEPKTRLLAAVVASALLSTTLLGGCASKSGASASDRKTTVMIGFAAPLTGDNAIYGQGMKRAVDMAVAEANASAAARKAGYAFVSEPQDDQGDPKQAVNVANLLASEPGVVAVVGHFNSGCSIPASAVYNGAGLAMVSVSTNPQLTAQGFDTVDRIVATDDAQGTYAGELVYRKLGYRKVVVINDSTPYGQGLTTEFTKRFTALGGTVTDSERIQPKDVDFSSIITKAQALHPDAIYYGGAHTEGALISKQAAEAGLDVPVVGGDMLFSDDYISIAGASNAEGDICTSLGLPLEQQPRGVEFKKAYVARYKQDPQAYDSYAYDSAWIIIKAVLKAGTDRSAVAKAIRGITYDGVTGVTRFDAKGDTTNKVISAYKVTDGKWQQIRD